MKVEVANTGQMRLRPDMIVPLRAILLLPLLAIAGCPQDAADDGSETPEQTTGPEMTTAGSSAGPSSGAGESTGADTDGPGGSSEGGTSPGINCSEDDLSALYVRYVEPFVSGELPQSCESCHMTGVNMSLYARDTPCDTMACMVNQGVVDLGTPANSQLLSMIMMGDPQSNVFELETEHDALLEWIEWSSQCHAQVCGEVSDACEPGSGVDSNGVNPIGDCSEDDLALSFFQNVMAYKGRCNICHSGSAGSVQFGPCNSKEDCNGEQLCVANEDGQLMCVPPGPYGARNAWFFEGDHEKGPLDWENPADRDEALRSMYNVVALGLADEDEPLDSMMMIKPLLEDTQLRAVYTDQNTIENIPEGTGVGLTHGGTSKFNFGCHGMPEDPPYCPLTEAIVDCRTDEPCNGDTICSDGRACLDAIGGTCRGEECYCRVPDGVCDPALGDYVDWLMYFQSCK